MPISYNPGIQDISGQLFAQNAAPGFAALSRGIQDRQEANERDVKNAQIAESVVKNNPDMLQQLGMTEEEFKLLPGREKFNRVTGATMAMGAQQERQRISAQMQEYAARAAAERSKGNYYDERQANDEALGRAVNTYGQQSIPGGPTGMDGQPIPLTEDQRQSRALVTPGLGGVGASRLYQMMMQERTKRAELAGKDKGPLVQGDDGNNYLRPGWGKLAVPQTQPGVTALPGAGQVIDLGNGRRQFVPTPANGPKPNESNWRPAVVNGKEVPGMFEFWNGKNWIPRTAKTGSGAVQANEYATGAGGGTAPALPAPLPSLWQRLRGGATPAAAAPTSGAGAAPVAGDVRQNADGVYEFDGQNWIEQ